MFNKVIVTDSSTGTQYQVKPLLPESFYSQYTLTPNAKIQVGMDYEASWTQWDDCSRNVFNIDLGSSYFEITQSPYPKDRNYPYFYDVDEKFYFRQEIYINGTFKVTLSNGDVHEYNINNKSFVAAVGYGTLWDMNSTLGFKHTIVSDWWWNEISRVVFTGTVKQRLLLSAIYFSSTRALFCYQFPDGYRPNNKSRRVFPVSLSTANITTAPYYENSYNNTNWNFNKENYVDYDLDNIFPGTAQTYARLL